MAARPGALPLLLLSPAASALDLPEIQARGSLRVIAAESEQPEMFDFEGDPAKPGFEREMVEGFGRLKRLRIEVVAVKAFADRIPALLRGDGDVIVGLVDTAERRRQIAFTAEVLPVRSVVVTHKPASPGEEPGRPPIEEGRDPSGGPRGPATPSRLASPRTGSSTSRAPSPCSRRSPPGASTSWS